jgi:hypothetical protein
MVDWKAHYILAVVSRSNEQLGLALRSLASWGRAVKQFLLSLLNGRAELHFLPFDDKRETANDYQGMKDRSDKDGRG